MAEVPEGTPAPETTDAPVGEAGGEQAGKGAGGTNFAKYSGLTPEQITYVNWSTIVGRIVLIVAIGFSPIKDVIWDVLPGDLFFLFLPWLIWVWWLTFMPRGIRGKRFSIVTSIAWELFLGLVLFAGLWGCRTKTSILWFAGLFPCLIWICNRISSSIVLSKIARDGVVALLLVVAIWLARERTRQEFYRCSACGEAYTCEDEAGRVSNGYCAKTPSHKHHGDIVRRYDAARGMAQVIGWTLEDVGLVKWVPVPKPEDFPKSMSAIPDFLEKIPFLKKGNGTLGGRKND